MNPRWESVHAAVLLLTEKAKHEGIPVADLAAILGVHPRQVPEWIDRVSGAGDGEDGPGMSLELDRDRVRAYLGPTVQGPLPLSLPEALALLLLLSQAEADTLQTDVAARAHRIRKRLLSVASDAARTRIEPVAGRLEVDPTPATPVLARVREAVTGRRVLELDYFSARSDALKTLSVRACACVQHGRHWYVVTDARHLLRVDRIREARLTDARFEPPADFDVDALPRDVMFVGEAPLEVVLETPAGRQRLQTASPADVKARVRSRGGESVLVSPPAVRAELVEELRDLLARYE